MLQSFVYTIVLSTVYDDTLYVVRPPLCTEANVLFEKNNSWVKLFPDDLQGITVLKTSALPNEKKLKFKVKFYFGKSSQQTAWQTLLVDKQSSPEPNKDTCGAREHQSTALCSTTLVFSIISSIFVIFLFTLQCFERFLPLNYGK